MGRPFFCFPVAVVMSCFRSLLDLDVGDGSDVVRRCVRLRVGDGGVALIDVAAALLLAPSINDSFSWRPRPRSIASALAGVARRSSARAKPPVVDSVFPTLRIGASALVSDPLNETRRRRRRNSTSTLPMLPWRRASRFEGGATMVGGASQMVRRIRTKCNNGSRDRVPRSQRRH